VERRHRGDRHVRPRLRHPAVRQHPTEVGPLAVALLVVGIGASLGGPTGYAINPARDLGPRIAHALLPIRGKGSSDWGYSWVPVVGPVIGGVLAGVAANLVGT
jgi:glycerol uptake facilitator protein